jgi:pyruvate,water dikinase
MNSFNRRVHTGLLEFDEMIDSLRLGDNVVWQVDSIEDYSIFVDFYVNQALADERNIVYMRFGNHAPLLEKSDRITEHHLIPNKGFESFATQVYHIIEKEGRYAFYVFDCLTDLLEQWCSDLMLGNFFKITCPHLFALDTLAYFAIIRYKHSNESIARIRETTQLLIDLKNISSTLYLHPLKVWERYSPTMFLPHKYVNGKFETITSSVENSDLFRPRLAEQRSAGLLDYWDNLFIEAEGLLSLKVGDPVRKEMFTRLIHLLIGKDPMISKLAHKFMVLEDIIRIKNRQIGTGYIGGKSVGMLIARSILKNEKTFDFSSQLEEHDSFYLGSDIFYTYLVQNGWWNLRMKQINPESYFSEAKILKEKLMSGEFPTAIRDRFMEMLEYFGQSPIIVRSSSLLEDNFGNAFAGKYESVFCVNQGSPEERYQEFVNAVRVVYASTMDDNALNYRLKRGLAGKDEQMALLVQRVSGDYHGKYFFPALAGVGNSSNLYVWDKQIDPHAGMLRLVFGLGTRAVDRTSGDYPRIVSLDKPLLWPVEFDKRSQYSQHEVDLLDLANNKLATISVDTLLYDDKSIDHSLFAEIDQQVTSRMRELGLAKPISYILTFQKLLAETTFPSYIKQVLSCLQKNYNYPVDIEYTVNFSKDNAYHVNLLQCRPLQTKGLGKAISFPESTSPSNTLISVNGGFMGGNARIPLQYIVSINPEQYSKLIESKKYSIARIVGKLNQIFNRESKSALLISPGRLGTTTPSLGVPVSFSEICNMSVICEVEFETAGLMPELSYGSHFFQDLVESDIFYIALFPRNEGTFFNEDWIASQKNHLSEWFPDHAEFENIIKVVESPLQKGASTLELYSDIVTQKCVCTW